MACRSIYSKACMLRNRHAVSVAEDTLQFCITGRTRSMATEAALSSSPSSVKSLPPESSPEQPFARQKAPTVLATLYSFPTLEPLRFQPFPSTFLHSPLRRDILHKAVIYEGDAHRFGRAKTKWRSEVAGSGRKIRPQKGTGQARLGDKKSPMLRGGGVAHGPKPRDFSSGLPRKVYDLAWRTALSYRYRRDQLVVVEDSLELHEADEGLLKAILDQYKWGKDHEKSVLITAEERPNLEVAMKKLGVEGRVLKKEDVDVKDLLEMGRIVIEKDALLWFEREHGVGAH